MNVCTLTYQCAGSVIHDDEKMETGTHQQAFVRHLFAADQCPRSGRNVLSAYRMSQRVHIRAGPTVSCPVVRGHFVWVVSSGESTVHTAVVVQLVSLCDVSARAL